LATSLTRAPASLARSGVSRTNESNVKPIAQTDSCQAHHLGYCLSGAMTVHMQDGTTLEISAGDMFDIPPGHDAEVTGDEPCTQLDFGGFGTYAQRQ
jgi:mannose-6-phosphate isomerase-like protein (cupin superfamily)